jgi:hypothetical protein
MAGQSAVSRSMSAAMTLLAEKRPFYRLPLRGSHESLRQRNNGICAMQKCGLRFDQTPLFEPLIIVQRLSASASPMTPIRAVC